MSASRAWTDLWTPRRIFAVEYALARLWDWWGVRPDYAAGHSPGAFAAACVAGVMTLADAARLVVERGRLLQSLPEGRMAAVQLPEPDVLNLLSSGLDIGAVNGPGRCTVTGPAALVEQFVARMLDQGVNARMLRIATAGHSALVDPIMDRFAELVADVRLSAPTTVMLSDSTGRPLTAAQACDPRYWSANMRSPVRFGEVLTSVLSGDDKTLLEVGPGTTVTSLARQHPAWSVRHLAVNSLPHPADGTSARLSMLTAAGRLWSSGMALDFARLHHTPRRRAALPSYPFRHRAFLVEPPLRAYGGGDSLTATQLAARLRDHFGVALRDHFGVALSGKEIFASPTSAQLADVLRGRITTDAAAGGEK